MRGKDVLEMQLNGSFTMLRQRVTAISDEEWTPSGIPGSSLLGFILWHGARTIDWAVHCSIQGRPEVADRPEMARLRASEFAYGAGITKNEADGIARSVTRNDIGMYLEALQPAALGWLREQTDGDLDRVPEFEAHQRVKPRYLTPPVWAEVSDLVGLPAWQILARPCISHIRVHVGEIDTLLQGLRARTPA